jgi:sialate O-acetylesterase
LINTSWGGTNIETWISWDKMGKKDQYLNADIAQMEKDREGMKEKQRQFVESLKNDKGMAEKWYDPAIASADWRKVQVPKLWEQTEIGNADGIIWFRKEFELPSTMEGKPVQLSLGPIDDNDITFVNGQRVGAINSWNEARNYSISPTILKKGKNTITIKVEDTGGGGGIYGEAGQLFAEGNGQRIPLAGEWEYKVSVTNIGLGLRNTGPNAFPSQLYNAMIAPIINYGIKGAIWYQGESNAAEGYYYRTLFAEMINDWRMKWGYEFPFFWVQLANYMKPAESPSQSNWAELREAQSVTLSLPATGQAVIIDIGEANDIHSRNKQDVGFRLALAAEKIAYGKDIIYSGPVYQSMTVNGNKIILSFSNIGTGLIAKDRYGYLKGFSIAGSDQKFVWAKAMMEGDKVIVFNEDINNPVAVRYAWADNPSDANFYNKEGLPASPFRTDNWKLKSQK